ncbi:MAG TPA: acetoin utilization protein AcuC, partial [Eubacteriaceae bacterium]|nr:acetoin utilization protein AcuC [Eubacteriaceae bacterium]
IPIEPFTEDESFLFLLENALYVVAEYFKPDIIVSQHGADGHFLDEMSHLSLTMETYRYIPKLIHKIAHEYAGGKWMAVGGGGYNVFDVVPRSWAMVWMVMNDWPLPQGPLPPKWIREVEEKTNHKVHASWEDDFTGYMPIPRKEEIKNINKKTLINSLYPINEGELGNDFFRKYRY